MNESISATFDVKCVSFQSHITSIANHSCFHRAIYKHFKEIFFASQQRKPWFILIGLCVWLTIFNAYKIGLCNGMTVFHTTFWIYWPAHKSNTPFTYIANFFVCIMKCRWTFKTVPYLFLYYSLQYIVLWERLHDFISNFGLNNKMHDKSLFVRLIWWSRRTSDFVK